MTLEELHALLTPVGQALLAEFTGLPLRDDDLLPVLTRYRQNHPATLVSTVIELWQLRRRARDKFPRADALFFTRDGLEMASADPVARHTAMRFAGLPLVYDLCCGIGGDLLALADTATRVLAVDCDPLALEMATLNAQVQGVAERITFQDGEVVAMLPTFLTHHGTPSAIFIDPSRRAERAAARRPDAYHPPLSWCLRLVAQAPRVAIKMSPALDYEHILRDCRAEVEVISLRGECKEALCWLGDFRTCARRATVLPDGATLTDAGAHSSALGEIGAWLYEPDPAIIRAHLVQRLAGECALRRLDAEIAYLTGDHWITSPFFSGYRVLEVIPWSLKRVNTALRVRGIGHIVIKKRGFPIIPETLRPMLKLVGRHHAVLICTKISGRPVVIIAESGSADESA